MSASKVIPAIIFLISSSALKAVEDPFHEMFAIRTSIKEVIGVETWIVSYGLNQTGTVKAWGMNKDGRVFKVEGVVRNPDAVRDILLIDAYDELEVSYSDNNGDLYRIELFGAEAVPFHWTYDSYVSFLGAFRHYGFEKTLEKSPRKYIFARGEPEILVAAMKLQPPRSNVSKLLDSKVGVLGFYSEPTPEGGRRVTEVESLSVAGYAGLLAGDRIIGFRCDYQPMDYEGLTVALKENVGTRFDAFVKRGEDSRTIVMFRPTPLEYRLLAMPGIEERARKIQK